MFALVALGSMALLAPRAALADSYETFTVSGTFADDSTLSGTITVDLDHGGYLSGADLNWSDVASAFTVVNLSATGCHLDGDLDLCNAYAYVTLDGTLSNYLYLVFPVASFVDYSGGSLCSDTVACGLGPSLGSTPDPDLTMGSVTPEGVAGPEPSSLLLLGIGVLGLSVMASRCKNAAQSAAA